MTVDAESPTRALLRTCAIITARPTGRQAYCKWRLVIERTERAAGGHTASLQKHPIEAIAVLAEPTRRRLYEFVVGHGPVGRDAAADALGLSRELAAFHLDRLAEAGLVHVTYRRLSGRSGPGAGRPAKLYERAPTDIAVSLPQRRYESAAEVFAEGLENVADEVGADHISQLVDEPARRRGLEAGASVRRQSGRTRSRRVRREQAIRELADEGFEPAVDPDSQVVTLRNCPYRVLSDRHRELTCGMNLAWAQGFVEGAGDVGLEPRLDVQPGRCCVVLQPTSGS